MGFQFHPLKHFPCLRDFFWEFVGPENPDRRQERRPLGHLLGISCSELDQQVRWEEAKNMGWINWWMNQLDASQANPKHLEFMQFG